MPQLIVWSRRLRPAASGTPLPSGRPADDPGGRCVPSAAGARRTGRDGGRRQATLPGPAYEPNISRHSPCSHAFRSWANVAFGTLSTVTFVLIWTFPSLVS